MVELASVLVGRREELAAFERALVEVERGWARAVALRGEPGIGKSRLLGELAGRARELGLLVLEGRAAELERDLTFALLLDALEPLASDPTLAGPIEELEGWQLGELAAVLPAVGPLATVEAVPASASVTAWRGRCVPSWSGLGRSDLWRCCWMMSTGRIRYRRMCWRCCCTGRRAGVCCWGWPPAPGEHRGSSRRWRRRSSAAPRRCSSWDRCRSRPSASCCLDWDAPRASVCTRGVAATPSISRSSRVRASRGWAQSAEPL
jgi:AAA ATPase domain